MTHTDTTRDEILEHMAKAFFACAWADYSEQVGPHYPAGCEIMNEMPDELDPAATEAAKDLAEALEASHRCTLTDVFRKAVELSEVDGGGDRPPTTEYFGHYAAMGSMGHGVSLHDALGTTAAVFVDVPYMEFTHYDLDSEKYPIPADAGE